MLFHGVALLNHMSGHYALDGPAAVLNLRLHYNDEEKSDAFLSLNEEARCLARPFLVRLY